MNLSTSGPFTVMTDESNDVSSDKVYIMIRYFDQDSRSVKKTIVLQTLSKSAERLLHHLISFHRLPHSTDTRKFFSDSAFTGIGKHT